MYDNDLYAAYGYTLDEADDTLRRLERAAKQSPVNLKRYIQGVQQYLGYREAVLRLVRDFDILPGTDVSFQIIPEADIEIEGNAGDAKQEAWVIREIRKGNYYAWCAIRCQVDWADRHGHCFLGAVSARGRKDAEEAAVDEGMVYEAAHDLVNDIPSGKAESLLEHLTDSEIQSYYKSYMTGKEDKDWVKL